ncbi:MAG: hypothetical protein HYT08_04135 [Candidatus Levybacteria bacterium]|nr:hypothetical protein [Candidatus Levybacteria bacterium]
MDTPKTRKGINEYLYYEYASVEPGYKPENISADYPYKLRYEGHWAIPNNNNPNDSVLVYLVHEEGRNQETNPDLYAYHIVRGHVTGADETKGRSVEEYIKSKWEPRATRRLD